MSANKSVTSSIPTFRVLNSYTLRMDICRLPFSIHEISIDPSFINTVEFPLIPEKVGLPQRPGLSYGESIQLVTNLKQPIVLVAEALVNLPLSVKQTVSHSVTTRHGESLDREMGGLTVQAQSRSNASTGPAAV
jgi:hypothetical protein